MFILNFRVTHKEAPVDILDRLAFTDIQKEALLSRLREKGIQESVVITTCNRTELFLVGKNEEEGLAVGREVLAEFCGKDATLFLTVSYLDAVRHLFEIASSIDSLIVGETQIQNQVKLAYEFSRERRYTGPVLDLVFTKALRVGKRVRSETKISEGSVSISSAAVALANSTSPLLDKNILIIGAGNMAELVGQNLALLGCENIFVANRTQERAVALARRIGGHPVPFEEIPAMLEETDVVFLTTSCPHTIIHRHMVPSRPLTIVDISLPSDVDADVLECESVNYYDIDSLRSFAEANVAKRKEEAQKARTIIEEELLRFKEDVRRMHDEGVISSLRQYIEDIRKAELEKAYSLLQTKDERTFKVMDDFSRVLIKKIMHNSISNARSGKDMDMEKFARIFMGDGRVSKNKDEKIEAEQGLTRNV